MFKLAHTCYGKNEPKPFIVDYLLLQGNFFYQSRILKTETLSCALLIMETLFLLLFLAWVAGFWTASIWPQAFELLIAHVKVLISGCANSLKLYFISEDLHHLLEDQFVCKWTNDFPAGNLISPNHRYI